MTFLETFGFCKRCLKSWYLRPGTKICLCFVCMCFAILCFLLKYFPHILHEYVSNVFYTWRNTYIKQRPASRVTLVWFWLVLAAWPAQSCAVLRQVFVEWRRYRHSSLRLAAPLPRLGLAEALEGLAMLCWVYNDYVLKFKILSRRLKQIILTYMATVTSQDGWV